MLRVPMKVVKAAVALIAVVLFIVVLVLGGIWLWEILAQYVNPKSPTQRKDLVNVFVIIVASVVGFLTAAAAVGNFFMFSRSLRQQRMLEAEGAQVDALQSYFEHMGELLSKYDLAKDVQEEQFSRPLSAEAQTHTVLRRLDPIGKGHVVRFLQQTGLIMNTYQDLTATQLPILSLYGADLRHADLRGTRLSNAVLAGADLTGADLRGIRLDAADLRDTSLRNANFSPQPGIPPQVSPWASPQKYSDLTHTILNNADLRGANLREVSFLHTHCCLANFTRAKSVSKEQLEESAWSLDYAIMPDGSAYGEDKRPNR